MLTPRCLTLLQARRHASVGSLMLQRSGNQVEQAPPLRLAQGSVQGISVVTLEDSSPVSSVGVFVKAGSRFETPDAPGSAHFLKSTLLRVS
jgi:predicted Zn-dependent peptidase